VRVDSHESTADAAFMQVTSHEEGTHSSPCCVDAVSDLRVGLLRSGVERFCRQLDGPAPALGSGCGWRLRLRLLRGRGARWWVRRAGSEPNGGDGGSDGVRVVEERDGGAVRRVRPTAMAVPYRETGRPTATPLVGRPRWRAALGGCLPVPGSSRRPGLSPHTTHDLHGRVRPAGPEGSRSGQSAL
jgi:hypothetical protein